MLFQCASVVGGPLKLQETGYGPRGRAGRMPSAAVVESPGETVRDVIIFTFS